VVIDNQGIADSAQRERALDPTESFIVQAPAGSGKTELLTQRYLNLLAHVDAPEEVVAITFTRKAASEMRNRILAAFERARDEAAPMQSHERLTWGLARKVRQRDQAGNWSIEANPSRLRIQTIDSLCASLTRQMPLLSRFGAPPDVTEDAYDLYLEAAANTIAELESGHDWSTAISHLLGHLDNNLAALQRLIAAMLARRDQWLRHVADRRHPRIERRTLEHALHDLVQEALADLCNAVPGELSQEILSLARFAAANLKAAGAESATLTCLDMASFPGPDPEALDQWRGIAQLLLTRDGDRRRKVSAAEGFPAPSKSKDASEKARFEQMKNRFTELMLALASHDLFCTQLHAVRSLPPVRYTDSQWETMQALFDLLRLAVAQLEVVFQERRKVDFPAISQAALQALGEPDRPSDLALALDYRISHILIDEFQDTSLSQYALLERLTAGWEPGDGRTLFAVGDPMQSIYRFREAEVGLYLRARREGVGHVGLAPLVLSVNFRSQKGVVDWVNQTFRRVLPSSENVATGAVTYASSVAFHGAASDSPVTVHPFIGRDDSLEAQQVVELLRAAKRRYPNGSVAILVRGRSHLAEIVSRLKQESIAFRAIEIEHLSHRPVVQDLLALTSALVHLGDRVAWLAVLRAPWCGLTLADLEKLVGDQHAAAIWDLMGETERCARLGPDGQQRLVRVREVLDAALSQRSRYRLRRWVEGTWLALGGPACVANETDLEDAQVFLDLLDHLDVAGTVELDELAAKIAKLFALPDLEADSSLQVMTIHKAKGLEFDTVIVPGLGRTPPPDEPRLLMWLERPRGADRSDLLLAPIRQSGQKPDSEDAAIYKYLIALDQKKAAYEDGRLLYVAATRAKHRLHLLGHVEFNDKEGEIKLAKVPSGSLLYQLWPVVEPAFVEAKRVLEKDKGGDSANSAHPPAEVLGVPMLRRLSSDWRLPDAPPSVILPPELLVAQPSEKVYEPVEFVWASETARHVGTVVHQLLQQLAGRGLNVNDDVGIVASRGSIKAALARLGVCRDELEQAVERVHAALSRSLADERGRWILSAAHREARNEYPLTGVLEGHVVNVVIDRTFVDDQGIRWIIDYKTGSHEGGGLDEFLNREQERYRDQLERYAALMRAKESRPVRMGLYFPLLGAWREWG
jgi:ATP-dependent helicase/nuclease subunit A